MKILQTTLLALGILGFHGAASAALITGVTIDSVSSQFGSRDAIFSADGSGLTAGQHTNVANGNMWLTQNETTPDITYDLGSVQGLIAIDIWNYNEPSEGDRGANEVQILVSPDGNPANLVALINVGGPSNNFTFLQATGLSTDAGFSLDLSNVSNSSLLDTVRLVRFDILSNYGDGSFTGLSEVQFSNVLPEPSTCALLVLGLIGTTFRRTRKRKA